MHREDRCFLEQLKNSLEHFGVGSIDELPVISEDMVEQYKEEAEYEIASELKEEAMNEEQLTLDI